MRHSVAIKGVAIGLLVVSGCVKPKVWEPPRIDLLRYGTLGLVEFSSEQGHGAAATQRFIEALHASQTGVPVLELGPLGDALRSVGHEEMSPQAALAIGERAGVDVIIVGSLDIDRPRPKFSVQSLTQANASVEILGTLSARILDARSGATIWSNQARGKRTLAQLSMSGASKPEFGAVAPDSEHAQLIAWLVDRVTDDFRGRWTRH